MNYPIGIESSINPALFSIHVQKNCSIIIFSDVILEQENTNHIEYGEERIKFLITSHNHEMLNIEKYVEQDIDRFRGIMPQQDDMSLLLFIKK